MRAARWQTARRIATGAGRSHVAGAGGCRRGGTAGTGEKTAGAYGTGTRGSQINTSALQALLSQKRVDDFKPHQRIRQFHQTLFGERLDRQDFGETI